MRHTSRRMMNSSLVLETPSTKNTKRMTRRRLMKRTTSMNLLMRRKMSGIS